MSTLLAAATTAAQNSLAVDILSGAVVGGTAILYAAWARRSPNEPG